MDMGKLKEEVKLDEGYRDSIYLDHLGNKTVGYGHLLTENDWFYKENVGFKLNEKELEALLLDDLTSARRDCEFLVNDFNDLPNEAKLVLCNMAFQLGRNRLSTFKKMLAAVEKQDFPGAAAEMLDSRWAKEQTPERAKRLAARMGCANVEEA